MPTTPEIVHAPGAERRLAGSLPFGFLALGFLLIAAVPVWRLYGVDANDGAELRGPTG